VQLAACATRLPEASLERRLAAQNALFEAMYEADLEASPELATAHGDYRFNDRLDDYSLAAARRQNVADERFRARLKAIPPDGFPEQDRESRELLLALLQQRLADHALREYEMPVDQMAGVHLDLADLPLAVPLDSVRHYDDYLARLRQIPRVLAQTREVLRAGVKDGLVPVRFLLEKVPVQCRAVIEENPFLLPVRDFPEGVPVAERQRLTAAISAVVTREVLPAYEAFARFVATEYAPRGRTTLAVTSLPAGERRYRNLIRSNTSQRDLTAEQIHAIGLREIARLEAEMSQLARREGFADLASLRAALATDRRYRATSAEQMVESFRERLARMQAKLPELFGFIPDAPLSIEPVPEFQLGGSTHYLPGTPDGTRPGRIVVATADFAARTLVDVEATAYHEGVPGHHLQLSVAQRLSGLPRFRQHLFETAYGEGWALYAEGLGKEVGLYQDPMSDYGRLASELFRAVRLVVDTGIHAKGWTREQVVEFFRQSGAVDEPTLQAETDRYIAWPGQALAYKMGQLKFRELRERAQTQLGPRFDVRRFHDTVLGGGVLTLDLLDARVERWIAAERAATPAALPAEPR
jgi:uncharacterized protein (DUF885 family)